MRKQKQFSIFTFLLFVCAGAGLTAQSDVALHLIVTEMTSASAPRAVGESILLSYKPVRPIRFVGAAFSHENYRTIHTYSFNENGVYFLTIPIPAERSVMYRIVVDGLWTADPANPVNVKDSSGLTLSVLPLPDRMQEEMQPGVSVRNDGRVRFTFRGDPGTRVSVAGDFNNWDPFMYFLDEVTPGVYSITLRMRPGRHDYYYFYDGNRVADPSNASAGTASNGTETSTFLLPPS